MLTVSTPVADFVEGYARRDPLRLHMPGHKGKGETERLDITEVTGAPALYPASGILRESEERAAELFGTGRTVYSAEGSSLCIRAMLFLARLQGLEAGRTPVILAGRNAHRSFLSAAALMDLEIRWLMGDSLLSCLPTPVQVAEALDGPKDLPAAVYLTSPDYLGFRADVSGIARICHDRGVPLLVDNAHGAYLRFLPRDEHPLSLGADLVCDSAHKTLPVLTGGAYLHIHRKAPALFAREAERGMALFASTSPSWLILQSLDRANGLLASNFPAALADFLPLATCCRDRIRAMGYQVMDTEPLKITLAPKCYGYTGEQLHEALQERGIEAEFADPDFLVLMPAPVTGAAGLDRLEAALKDISRRDPIMTSPPPLPRGRRRLSPREAQFSAAETLPLARCVGRVLADPCVSCPPAVPILICGEEIDEDALRCFRYYGREELACVRESGFGESENGAGRGE